MPLFVQGLGTQSSFPARSVARREMASPTDVRPSKSAAIKNTQRVWQMKELPEHFSLSLHVPSTWSLGRARVHRKEIIPNYRIKLSVQRVLCFVCALWLASHVLSLKSRRHFKGQPPACGRCWAVCKLTGESRTGEWQTHTHQWRRMRRGPTHFTLPLQSVLTGSSTTKR